ncbi:MAG TPA: phosphatase PAP2 family protein [bacterium]|nr:phosphatase PAP2 family protein [bacterium]HMW33656.1 phosphatase PAP2 family protein [bacterium]HMW34813.1 phosphatase PAP2 family protein [bacterium]HMY35382.1 phosphatase PAP2 family protein [bacterium]HMZ03196.1 phosphatase PAP2 family protein [bacterium]
MKTFLNKINPVDWAYFIYQAVIIVMIIVFRTNLDQWASYVLWHLLFILAGTSIIHFFHDTPVFALRMFRHWYVILTYAHFFIETGMLNQIVFQGFWDKSFIEWDIRLFGTDPNLWFYDHLNNFWFNEIIHFCYFSYYIVPTALGVILFTQRDTNYFRLLLGFTVTFYVCYFIYILTPVRGPLEMREVRFLDGGWFVQIMNWIYANAEKPGAAFPSSHVAIGLLTLYYAFRYRRNLFWIFLPFMTGLVFSTVYCFYHYVVDVFAGVFVSIVMFWLCEKWYAHSLKSRFPTSI